MRLISISGLLLCQIALARPQLPPLSSSIMLESSGLSGITYTQAGSEKKNPAWYVMQWQNPVQLTARLLGQDPQSWTLANQYSRIKYYAPLNGKSNVYEFLNAFTKP